MAQDRREGTTRETPFQPEILWFVSDMITYVLMFSKELDPPTVNTGPSVFTNNIGKALVKLIQLQKDDELDSQILEVVANFISVPPDRMEKEFTEKVCCEFLHQFFGLLQLRTAQGYFQYFIVVCKLCLAFSAVGLEGCIRAVLYFTQGIIIVALEKPSSYLPIEEHAKLILNAHSSVQLHS